jgi:predicted FMN-binding regulatory protein PaiB
MGREELLAFLADTAAAFEPGPTKWRIEQLEPALRDELLAQIVGLAIDVDRWECKLKLSQNRSAEDATASGSGPHATRPLGWVGYLTPIRGKVPLVDLR